MKQERVKNKVLVAMSGGVDSSVAAALLKRAGFEVTGIFMKLIDSSSFKKAESRARKIARILKIRFLTLDLKKEFKKRIINYLLQGYKNGVTPNPCVMCNKEIKLGLLLEKALSLKASFMATGHYVRIKKKGRKIRLFKAKDKNKDQSYFLWTLNQKKLKRILFPIGDYTRNEVERMAGKLKLPFAGVRKSQEICFIPNTVEDFLKKYLKEKKGKIVDKEGKLLGEHEGLFFYTIGQRKGIKIPQGPYYILDKNLRKNTLIVTKNQKDLDGKESIAKKVNWISGKAPKFPLKISAQIRYRHKPASAVIYKIKNYYKIIFKKPQRAVTPGQSIVFYQGREILGGGII